MWDSINQDDIFDPRQNWSIKGRFEPYFLFENLMPSIRVRVKGGRLW